MNLGEKIKALRLEKGLSLRELAAEIRSAKSTVRDWEIGVTRPRQAALHKLAAFFDVTPAELEYGAIDFNESQEAFDGVRRETPAEDETELDSWSVPMRGYVGANTEFTPFTEFDETIETRFLPRPRSEAIIVDGDSMDPPFPHGTVLLYSERDMNPDRYLKRAVIVGLPDGRVLFKVLKRGSAFGLYRLCSLNPDYPELVDQRIDYVLPLDNVQF